MALHLLSHTTHAPALPALGCGRVLRRSVLCASLLGALGVLGAGSAVAVDTTADAAAEAVATVEFNEDLLRIPVDVRMFAEGNPVPAGTYRIDLYMNDQWKGRTDVRFQPLNPGDRVALPCFDASLLDMLGFDLKQLNPNVQPTLQGGSQLCTPIEGMFDGASANYDSGALRLDIVAPQVVMRREARGYVDPSLWDNGIPAATLQYNYNAYHSDYSGYGGSRTSHYLGLRAGLNVGPWRVRYNASANHSDGNGLSYRSNTLYVERALPAIKSRITAGQTVTEGQVFDSLPFTGVRMESDERMRPDSQRGFAPTIRGIANSNARVRVSQLGNIIYETTVSPGAFVIDDLYPTGTSGDLLVTVTESDGSERSFTVTYAGMVELVRPGRSEYTLSAGRYRSNGSLRDEPMFAQATLRHGIANSLTGYTGLMVAEGYASAAAGFAFNIPVGALSADMTLARTRIPQWQGGGHHQGYSARVSYAKMLPVINTNVTLASYRYSSNGYYEPAEAFRLRELGMVQTIQRRNRYLLSASQTLPGSLGYLGLSASSQDYWRRPGRDTQYQINYSVNINRVSLGLAASRVKNTALDRWENQYMLNMSMPLGASGSAPNLNTGYTHQEGGQSVQASVSGMFGRDHQFSYGVYGTVDDRDGQSNQYSGGANIGWAAPKATIGANMSASRGSRQYGVSMTGGVVAFGGGVVLTNSLGDTIAVVQAKDAAGARVTNAVGVRLDGRGHAVVPYLSPYRQNEVRLDPAGLSTDVALASTSQRVAPTAGAVVLLRYETERSYSILVTGRRADGSPLPFAAGVFDANNRNVGYVAQAGQALVNVDTPQGALSVRWGQGANESCMFTYAVNEKLGQSEDFRRVDAVCVTGGRFATDPQEGDGYAPTRVSSR